jgi:hypothetical protein
MNSKPARFSTTRRPNTWRTEFPLDSLAEFG